MSEPKPDGTATLLGVLYPGVDESKLVRKYLGGSEAPMLYEAAEKITSLEAERDKLREAILDLNCEMAVSYSDERIRYVEVQIATTAYEDFKELAAALNTDSTD